VLVVGKSVGLPVEGTSVGMIFGRGTVGTLVVGKLDSIIVVGELLGKMDNIATGGNVSNFANGEKDGKDTGADDGDSKTAVGAVGDTVVRIVLGGIEIKGFIVLLFFSVTWFGLTADGSAVEILLLRIVGEDDGNDD